MSASLADKTPSLLNLKSSTKKLYDRVVSVTISAYYLLWLLVSI